MSFFELLENTPKIFGFLGIFLLGATVIAFIFNFGFKFRIIGATIFSLLLSLSSWAFIQSYTEKVKIEDAKFVRDSTKFPPIGHRGLDGGNNDGKYARLDIEEYLTKSNEERLVIYQIETPEAFDHIEAIAEMEGVDGLFFGPGDYSLALGVPGQMDHPEVSKVRKLVAELARKHNKIAATPGGPNIASEYIDMGYNLLNIGSDVIGLTNYAEELINTFDKINS